MAFIEAKCKNCGGDIRLDEKLTRGKCEFCGTEFVKSDMIVNNNYNISNATLVIDDEKISEQMFINADTYLSILKDYDKAFDAYSAITESKTNDYRGWWGLLRAFSHDFTSLEYTEQERIKAETFASNAIKLAPEKIKPSLTEKWNNYQQQLSEYKEKEASKRRESYSRESLDRASLEKLLNAPENMSANHKAAKRNNILCRVILDVVSIAIPAFVILFGFFNYNSGVVEYGAPVWAFCSIGLGVSAVFSIVAQLVASAPECFVAHTIATLLVVVYLCYRFLIDDMPRTTFSELLVLLLWGIVTAAILIVPPFIVFRHLAHKKLGYK